MTTPTLPPLPEISWPKSDDKRQAAILLGSQMAEAQALWQLRARAQQVRQQQRLGEASPSRAPAA
jgi:hypothetical protein